MAFRDEDAALLAKLENELEELRIDLDRAKRKLGGDERGDPHAHCPMCGSEAHTWGELYGQGLRFVGPDSGFMDRNFSLATRMRARRCDGCRCVLVFDGPT